MDKVSKNSSDYLQELNDSLGVVIFAVIIPERIIEYVNSAIENVFGYKPDECIGKKTEIFYLALEGYQDFGRSLENSIKEGKDVLRMEGLFKRKNGEIFSCEVTTTFIKENEKIVRGISILQDITERKKTERLLQEQKKTLEQKNIALSEILGQIEIEKKQIKDNVIANAEKLLLPIIQKLRLKGESRKYVQLLRKNLQELTSSFGKKLTEKESKLTSREIEICNMIKNGITSKEIANLLNISLGTTEKHRNNIRKKLDIVNKDINLSSVLKTF
jgi:PAS domain S-box-containing protein